MTRFISVEWYQSGTFYFVADDDDRDREYSTVLVADGKETELDCTINKREEQFINSQRILRERERNPAITAFV